MAKKNISLKEMSNHMSILKRHIYDELRREGKLLNAWWGLPQTIRGSIEEHQLIQEKLKKGLYDESERHRLISFYKSHPPLAFQDQQNPKQLHYAVYLDEIVYSHYNTIFESFESFESAQRIKKRVRALPHYNNAFDFYAMHYDCLDLDKIPSEIRFIIRNRQNAKARYHQRELLIDLLFKKECDQYIKNLFKAKHSEVNVYLQKKVKNILANSLPFVEKDPNKKKRKIEKYIQKELKNSFKLFFNKQLLSSISLYFPELLQNKRNEIISIKLLIAQHGIIFTPYKKRNTINSIPISQEEKEKEITEARMKQDFTEHIKKEREREYFEKANITITIDDQFIFNYPQTQKIPTSIKSFIKKTVYKANQKTTLYALRQIDFYEKLIYYIDNSIKKLPENSDSQASKQEEEKLVSPIQQQYINRKDQRGMSIYDELQSLYNQQIKLFLQGKEGSTLVDKLVSQCL